MFNVTFEHFKQTESELNEADRRAGAAERKLASYIDGNIKRNEWLSKAKKEAEYDDNISFDVVWAETLALAKKAKEAGL